MLFAYSCLVGFYFVLLGLGAWPLWLASRSLALQDEGADRKIHALLLMGGWLLGEFLCLLSPSLRIAFYGCAALGMLGLGLLWKSSRGYNRPFVRFLWPYQTKATVCLALLLLCLTHHALSAPFFAEDARIIWFFHAKIIAFFDSVQVPSTWKDPSLFFIHAAYPKGIAVMGALGAQLSGVWNDVFPKLGMVFLLIPAFFSLAALHDRFWPFAWLWYALVLSQFDALTLGLADAPFALYAGLALLYSARWIKQKEKIDGILAIGSFAIAAQIKNEALLLGLALMPFLLRPALRSKPSRVLAALSPLLGFFLWNFFVRWWDLREAVPLIGAGFGSRFLERAFTSMGTLLRLAFVQYQIAWIAFMAALALGLGYQHTKNRPPLILVGTPVLYLLGLFVIYLGTPHDFAWHLSTSLDRTLMGTRALWVIAAYWGFSDLVQVTAARRT